MYPGPLTAGFITETKKRQTQNRETLYRSGLSTETEPKGDREVTDRQTDRQIYFKGLAHKMTSSKSIRQVVGWKLGRKLML